MFAPGNIAGTVTQQKASAFVDNATAVVGLLVLGVPFSMSTIRMTLASWALIAAANAQLVLGRLRPQMRLLGRPTARRAPLHDGKSYAHEARRLANISGSRR
jgi:hypothetical protein